MLELQGVARRTGAGLCTLTLVGLCLGATAPASFAAERAKPAKHEDNQAKQAAPTEATPAKAKPAKAEPAPAKPAKHRSAQHAAHRVKHREVVRSAPIKLDDLLLPGALAGAAATDPLLRRPSALLVVPAVAVPEASVPAATAPLVTAPVISVVVKKAPNTKAARSSSPTVSAEALLDVTTVSPVAARTVLAPRRLAIGPGHSLVQVTSARAVRAAAAAVTRAAAPAQVVNRELSHVGAWPAGPVSLRNQANGLPMAVALGGLVLALAAARGVSRMRQPRTDDPDLNFSSV